MWRRRREAGSRFQSGEDLGRDLPAQLGVSLEQACDISEVLLALARPASRVRRRPDFPLEDVLYTGDWQSDAEDLTRRRPVHEGEISRIGLDLRSQVVAIVGDVQIVVGPVDRYIITQ